MHNLKRCILEKEGGVCSVTKIQPITGIDLKVTNACNLQCKFCVNADYPGKCGDVNVDLAITAVNQLLESNKSLANLQNVFYTGGEPLLRLNTIIRLAKALPKTIFSGVNTNGLLLDEDVLRKLKNVNIKRIKFSYDTTDKKHYTVIRNGSKENDLKKLEKNIELAVERGFIVFLRIALGRMNYKEIIDIYQKANSMGVDTLQIKPIVPSGRATLYKGQLLLAPSEVMKSLRSLHTVINDTKTKVSISCFPPALGIGLNTKCCANKDKLYLDVNGNIYLCNYNMDDDNRLDNYHNVDGIKNALIERKNRFTVLFNNYVISSCPATSNYQ